MKILYNIFLFVTLYWCLLLSKLIPLIIKKKSKNIQKKDVLFLECLPVENAGYNYRSKNWAKKLEDLGLICEIKTIIEDRKKFDKIVQKSNLTHFFVLSMRRRLKQCVYARNFKTVVVRRELLLFNDYGDLFMEKMLYKLHDNIILDFDDDISAAKKQPRKIKNFYGRLMQENGNKFSASFSYYHRFITASDYLKNKIIVENSYVSPEKILVVPTCVDYNKHKAKEYPDKLDSMCFGWIGGDHNYFLLDLFIPLLNKLSKNYKFSLLVIGGQKYEPDVDFNIEFIPWSLTTEVESLYKIDIGLMPLEDDLVNRGKSGFKLIQYMGLGIVSIANGLTINNEIVDNGVNSFIVNSFEEWEIVLTEILENKVDFKKMGELARQKIVENYTFNSNSKKYFDFINN
ncbi:MAG: hypothetical protein PHW83_07040 [Bacteroidales bacterium]|nr:hypothetical protein [Bacteroidales bacterium]